MKALILAAGRGRRMKGLTAEQPKALLKVGGKPLLRHAIENLNAAGVSEIGIVTGYQASLLQWPEFREVFHNPRWESTQMVYSLFQAARWLSEGPTLVIYSDILFTPKTIQSLKNAPGDIAITNNVNWKDVWEKRFADPLSDAETFKRDASGRMIEIGLKPSALSDIQGQYMGLLKINPVGWKEFEALAASLSRERFEKIDMTSTLNELILKGVAIQSVDAHESWYEFDSEEDLRSFE